MPSQNLLIMWLAYSAAAATLFLAAGTVAAPLRRQPVERLRIIQWTLLACLLAPLVNQLPGVPRWSLAVATSVSQPIEPETNALPDAAQPKTTVRGETPAIIAPREIPRNESRPSEPMIGNRPLLDRSSDHAPIPDSRANDSVSAPSPLAGEGRGEGDLRRQDHGTTASHAASASSPSPLAGEGRGEGAEIQRSFPWPRIVLAVYALGVVVMLAWYLIGLFTLAWLNATARAVPDEVAKQFRAATSDPAALRVRLCMHSRVELPLAYGLVRPTAESHQPIEGAEVTIWVADGLGSPNFKRLLAVKSDAMGTFTFPVSTSLAKPMHMAPGEGGSAIYLDFWVKHPNYATRRQNLTVVVVVDLGGRPMIRRIEGNAREVRMPIEMQRGEIVTAVLKRPDGKPAAGVKIVPKDAQEDALTDADGRFQMNFPASGDASFWIYPRQDGIPVKYELHEKRGDLGAITLQSGPTIKGRVIGADGKPLAGIYLQANDTSGRWAREFIHRAAITDAEGNFAFAPLPPGDYCVEPQNAASDLSTERLYDSPVELHPHPLPAFFAPQKVTLVAGQEPQPIEFRPPETVAITGKVSAPTPDRPARGANQNPFEQYKPWITGVVNGFKFSPVVTIDAEGNFSATVPRGLQDVMVKFGDSQVRAPQWRTAKDKPLVDPSAIPLGTVNEDVHGLEIIYP